MTTQAIFGILLIVIAVPGMLAGVALLLGKFQPTLKSVDPDRTRKVLGLGLVVSDAALLMVGLTLLLLDT
jgi:hypothetical protein